MDAKEIYESLDTVYARLPDDAARQEFVRLVDVIGCRVRRPVGFAVNRWLALRDEM